MKCAELPNVEATKMKNIVEMALDYTGMIRIFVARSTDHIATKLKEFFGGLAKIQNRDDYETRHRSFCESFAQDVCTAKKMLKNGKVLPSGPSSYGQAAKVLDIAIKVYVYYCAQPTPEIAERIVPWLHGAFDTPILEYLKKSGRASGKILATTIKGIDKEAYQVLQSQLLAERDDYDCKLYPVQYDDILWRSLNRS